MILHGDAVEMLRTLPGESVQCCVSSPPYWRQRDYGVPGQIGLEDSPEEYIAQLTAVYAEVRRMLKPDGTCFVNIGDKWASDGNGGGSFMPERAGEWAHVKDAKSSRRPPSGYKRKDLIGLPFMLAFAMRSDGWFWRQCNVWAKPNCMPESVMDRTTASHEYVLHFSKRESYYYSAAAVRLPAVPESIARLERSQRNEGTASLLSGVPVHAPGQSPHGKARLRTERQRGHSTRHAGFNARWDAMTIAEQQENGANLRSVWWIATAQYDGAHFATMPELLAQLCILAGTRPGDTVLDPFAGSGTTGKVALELGRAFIGCEMSAEYMRLAAERMRVTVGMDLEVARQSDE